MQENNQTEAPPSPEEKKPSLLGRLAAKIGKKRLIIGTVCVLAGLWAINAVMGWFGDDGKKNAPVAVRHVTPAPTMPPAAGHDNIAVKAPQPATPPSVHRAGEATPRDTYSHSVTTPQLPATTPPAGAGHGAAAPAAGHGTAPSATGHGAAAPAAGYGTAASGHAAVTVAPAVHIPGVAFVSAVIEPLHYELNDRFWGWRPNDILNFTDNVNNFQLGVLEVTRRTAVILAERISRTGSTAAFDRDLENAMNWLMIRPTQYWFPSPESMYGDALEAMESYKQRVIQGAAYFHARADNLIPLLMAYEDLLGSSDENLVKHSEANGDHVSFFKADDYFFYAKGVATAMHPMLEAVAFDFQKLLEARRGAEVLHHAIESLEHAMQVSPIVITDADLSGILANHRANMAAPISHARFYLGVLIKTLST